MELDNLTPDMPHLIADMGIHYDPAKLAAELKKRPTGAMRDILFARPDTAVSGPPRLYWGGAAASVHPSRLPALPAPQTSRPAPSSWRRA